MLNTKRTTKSKVTQLIYLKYQYYKVLLTKLMNMATVSRYAHL